MENKTNQKVVIGMSGGVDSSVAAWLLLQKGYDCIGATMEIWRPKDPLEQEIEGGCCGVSAVEDARRVAAKLEIPYYVMNFRKEFEDQVISYFIREYECGNTPNPCIACNRYVKWESLLDRSLSIGAEYIATGHYARIVKLENGRWAIANSKTAKKDQTYALYNLTQHQLSHTLMPVGDYTKEEIRAMAEQIGLVTANKPDSQEICFIPDHDYAAFIEKNGNKEIPEGNFVTRDGVVLGRHKGITHYTVGQRKGLGLSLGHPCFVLEIRPETNEVVIGNNEDTFTRIVYANQLNFMGIENLESEERFLVKLRYSHAGAMATVRRVGEDLICCEFDEPQRASTPGQALVLYRSDYVAGGGTIVRR